MFAAVHYGNTKQRILYLKLFFKIIFKETLFCITKVDIMYWVQIYCPVLSGSQICQKKKTSYIAWHRVASRHRPFYRCTSWTYSISIIKTRVAAAVFPSTERSKVKVSCEVSPTRRWTAVAQRPSLWPPGHRLHVHFSALCANSWAETRPSSVPCLSPRSLSLCVYMFVSDNTLLSIVLYNLCDTQKGILGLFCGNFCWLCL